MSKDMPIVSRWRCGLLPVENIMYINYNYRKADIHTREEDLTVYCSRSEVEEYLDGRFRNCMKNLVVNFDEVNRIDNGVIYFKNGEELRLGRNNYIKARQNFAAYMKNSKKLLANVQLL